MTQIPARRSIPARAGEPLAVCGDCGRAGRWVYPRACGGTFDPMRNWHFTAMSSVYPRACGGTCVAVSAPRAGPVGLSPRVRGNRTTGNRPRLPIRSIPARAGEPVLHSNTAMPVRVYPRACGGTTAEPVRSTGKARWGLSPRVRGNRTTGNRAPSAHRPGSIPARAGEPHTCCIATPSMPVTGLSPRVRGNLRERPQSDGKSHGLGLSPRVRGNHPMAAPSVMGIGRGLSPRVRGNR